MTIYGYARVSTEDQHLDLQIDALKEAGCTRIFTDPGVSAMAKHRKGLEDLLRALEDGDTLVIWKIDRAFRNLRQAVEAVELFKERGIAFRSLTDQIDTATAHGRLVYQITSAMAEFERSLISERTRAGLAAARKRGKVIGRPKSLSPAEIELARSSLSATPKPTQKSIARRLHVSPQTLSRALKA
jgi:DNA invertase Pin-like site-specific DNA recombinase